MTVDLGRDRLLYRRQFLASTGPLEDRPGWRTEVVPSAALTVQTHPDLPVARVDRGPDSFVLVGYAFDPHRPGHSETDLLESLPADGMDTAADVVALWAGRFVLFAAIGGQLFVINDACGLRSVFYRRSGTELHLASQPGSLPGYDELPPSKVGAAFHSGAYQHSHEPSLPAGTSFKEGVGHLVPNHYLDAQTDAQVRFYPRGEIPQVPLAAAVANASRELVAALTAAAERFPLALPVTAGWDSRALLAGTANLTDAYCYTLLYRNMTPEHADVTIASQLLASMDREHHVIDCRATAPDDFTAAAIANTMFGNQDNADITYGLAEHYPADRVAVKGNCSEIARIYYADFIGIPGARRIASLAGWEQMSEFVEVVESWRTGAASATAGTSSWRLLDLFYWEHRMSTWQAQSQAEWDIAQETFTPFNYRPLLVAMMGAPRAARSGSNQLYADVIRGLCPPLMGLPVNPASGKKRVKAAAKDALHRASLINDLKYIVRRLKRSR